MLFPILVFLCWGSFLNVVAYRFIVGGSLFSRSECPYCQTQIQWYDLIPLVSWILLRGQCRTCKESISPLYPFIELFTALCCTTFLYIIPPIYFPSYFLFLSALIIVIRTDLEFMLIPQLCSLYLVPIGIVLSMCDRLPITPLHSCVAAAAGYGLLAGIAYLYKKRTGMSGMGDGDPELMAGIGSFVGINGVLHTLLVGSLSATIYALFLMLIHKTTSDTKIPFGPFLAFGSIVAVLHIFILYASSF